MEVIQMRVDELWYCDQAKQEVQSNASNQWRGLGSLLDIWRLGLRRWQGQDWISAGQVWELRPFEKYRSICHTQEPGETYDQYHTALRKLVVGCEFATITPAEILRDRQIFGSHDAKVRQWLLCKSDLTLASTDEICHATESMATLMNVIEGDHTTWEQTGWTSKRATISSEWAPHLGMLELRSKARIWHERTVPYIW